MGITREQIIKLHQMADSSGFQTAIKKMFPEAFEPQNACGNYNESVVDIHLTNALTEMELPSYCMFAAKPDSTVKKGFYLSEYRWELVPVDSNCYNLIPYKK